MKPSSDVPKRLRSAPTKAPPGLPAWKKWLFRAVIGGTAPLIVLALIELALRAFAYGYPTSFLLPYKRDGKAFFIQNNQFGRRFFGRQMTRAPKAFCIPQAKEPGTIRIFVLGESAAFGDPQTSFGLPRMLQAMLELRHPGTKFEVVNAAMTGINSHVILPIARNCVRAGADVWVVYMGNNEVVGPFGAGTVFGAQTPPLSVIRANLAMKSWRTGQLLQSLLERRQEEREWGGMAMFTRNQVAADDPRMNSVYANFERNLRSMLALASRNGVRVVASTVAVNLKDCGPFGSAHRRGLSEADLTAWGQDWQRGLAAQAAGNLPSAVQAFRDASRRDDSFAALHFALGTALSGLGQANPATMEFRSARDLDTLRFRCDRRLNDEIRRVVAEAQPGEVVLADAEENLSESSGGSPGHELFYDHVHLTFEGNYHLAQTLARGVEQTLGSALKDPKPWPEVGDCAQRLGWSDFHRREAGLEMLRRLSDPPFTGQVDHALQMKRYEQLVTSLADAASPGAVRATLQKCEAVRAGHPADAELCLLAGMLANAVGDGDKEVEAAQQATALVPSDAEAWSLLGAGWEKRQQLEKAAGAYREVLRWDEQGFYALNNLGRVLVSLGKTNDAIATYRRAVELKPLFSPAWLSLGELLTAQGRNAEGQNCISNALKHPIRSPNALKRLAEFCKARGWQGAAATNYALVVELDPTDVPARLLAGECFGAAGQPNIAEQWYAEAVRVAPSSGPAHFLYGRALGVRGEVGAAEAQFRSAVELMPDVPEARLNLAFSLAKEGRTAEAIKEYETILERWPTNQIARNNLNQLRAATAAKSQSP